MNCRECKAVLEEFLDQELDQETARETNLHLVSCEVCKAEFSELQRETAVFQGYHSEIDVNADLWTGIQAQLDSAAMAKPDRLRWRSLFTSYLSLPRVSIPVTAALVLIAVLATVAVMKRATQPAPSTVATSSPADADSQKMVVNETGEAPKVTSSPSLIAPIAHTKKPRPSVNELRTARGAIAPEPESADQLVREAEKKYLAAINMLSRDVARKHSAIDADTRLRLEQALLSIDRTIAATRRAVRQHPNDPVAAKYMLSAYARKVDTLRELATGGDF
jgi:hypothetical protein